MVVHGPTTECSAGLQSHTHNIHTLHTHTHSALMKEKIWIQSPEWLSFFRISDKSIQQWATGNHMCWILHFTVIFLWLCGQRYFVWQVKGFLTERFHLLNFNTHNQFIVNGNICNIGKGICGHTAYKSWRYVHFSTFFHAFIILFF